MRISSSTKSTFHEIPQSSIIGFMIGTCYEVFKRYENEIRNRYFVGEIIRVFVIPLEY
jgi:hypothetical protein